MFGYITMGGALAGFATGNVGLGVFLASVAAWMWLAGGDDDE